MAAMPHLRRAGRGLHAYAFPMHPAQAPQNFYERVYDLVCQVPAGTVVTYGQLAVLLGAPAASRAVGYALRALAGTSDVPWWRVINAQGQISLRGRGEGADIQRDLLEAEGVPFEEGRVNLRAYRWWPDGDNNPGVSDRSV